MGGVFTRKAHAYSTTSPPPSNLTAFNATEVTNLSGDPATTAVTLTILASELAPSTKYFGIWTAEVSHTAAGAIAKARLMKDSVEVMQNDIRIETLGPPVDYVAAFGVFELTTPGSPAGIVYEITIDSDSASQTAKCKNARITLFKAGASAIYAESLTRQTKTGAGTTSYSTAASLAYTPTGTEDWIIIATCCADGSSSLNQSYRLSDAGGSTADLGRRPSSTSERRGVSFIWPRPSVSGAQTVNIQYKQSNTAGTAGISEMRLWALRASEFTAVYSAVLGSDNTGTNTSYTTAHSLTQTPAAAKHITIAAWDMEGSSASESTYSQFLDSATTIGEHIQQPTTTTSDINGAWTLTHVVDTYAASSRTWAIQRKSETSATTRIKRDAAILVIELAA